jgi:Rrf2 family nitric oxide-sensitive transcriptional repressor
MEGIRGGEEIFAEKMYSVYIFSPRCRFTYPQKVSKPAADYSLAAPGGTRLRQWERRYCMNLSLFSDYSLRVLMYGALKGSAFQLDEVTNAYGISRNHLAKVVHSLSRLGYLSTRRGRGGGIELGHRAEEIRIGKLLRQTEGGLGVVECHDMATNTCRIAGSCRLSGALAEAMRSFYESLDRLTLHDLVAGPHRAGMTAALLLPLK